MTRCAWRAWRCWRCGPCRRERPNLKTSPEGRSRSSPPGRKAKRRSGKYSIDQAQTLRQAHAARRARSRRRQIEKDYLPEKFGVNAGGGVLRTETPKAGARNRARQPRHPAHLRRDPRRRDVRLGLGRREGPRPAARAGPRARRTRRRSACPGVNPFGLLLEQRSFTPSAEAIAFVEGQKKVLEEKGPEGEQVISGPRSVGRRRQRLRGNASRLAAHLPTGDTRRRDRGLRLHRRRSSATAAAAKSPTPNFLANLETKFGEEAGMKVFRDLREVNDPEAPTTTGKAAFPYDQEPTGPTPGAARDRTGHRRARGGESGASAEGLAAQSVELPARRLGRRRQRAPDGGDGTAARLLLPGDRLPGRPARRRHRRAGRRRADLAVRVHRPRPRLRVEPDERRGARTRRRSSSSSATPTKEAPPTRKSTSYVYNGECIPMTTVDAGELGAQASEPAHEVYFKETVHGPDPGHRAGRRAAVRDRQGPLDARPRAGGRGRVQRTGLRRRCTTRSSSSKRPTTSRRRSTWPTSTTNTSPTSRPAGCRSWLRAPNPSLPTLGTGEYDWTGLPRPRTSTRTKSTRRAGCFLNWNNKPAPEWGAASDEWSYGPIHRVQLYTGFKAGMTEANDASIMNKAATQDLRAVKVWPMIEEVLQPPARAEHTRPKKRQKIDHHVGRARARAATARKARRQPRAAIWTRPGRRSPKRCSSPVLGELARTNSSRCNGTGQRPENSRRLVLRRRLVRVRLQGAAARCSATTVRAALQPRVLRQRQTSKRAATRCGRRCQGAVEKRRTENRRPRR